jgi:hypothetical protein
MMALAGRAAEAWTMSTRMGVVGVALGLALVGLVAAAAPVSAACTINVQSTCATSGNCLVTVAGACNGNCTVNAVGTCNLRATCLVNAVATCNYPGCTVNVVTCLLP